MLKHEADLSFQNSVFSPDGNRLVSVGSKGMLYLWDVSKTFPLDFKKVHEGLALACAYSADGNYIITGGEDKSIKILKTKDLSLVKSIDGLSAQVRELAMSGNRLVALLQNSELLLFSTDTWEPVAKPRYAAQDSRVIFSNSGDRFYAWFANRVYAISAKDGELLHVFNTNYATPTDLAISADDKFLAIGFGQAEEIIRIYNTHNMALVKSLKKNGPRDYAKGLSFFHKSNKLLYHSNAASSNLRIFDMEKGTSVSVSKASGSPRTAISRDDSKVILSPKFAKSVQLMSVL
ncbi:WD40 repeat domain-containing protein [Rufibacter immobilis]|nr:hypothetical protein [Rufibacter immobilis]